MMSAESTQAVGKLTTEQLRALASKMVQLLETKCIRLDGHDPEWRRLFEEAAGRIESCRTATAFEEQVNSVLARGGLSHVAFFHQSAKRAPARYAINATFASVQPTSDTSRWMFQDVHEGGPADRAGIKPGDILVDVNGESVRPPVLPTFALGEDAAVTIQSGSDEPRLVRVVLPKPPASGKPGAKPPMAEPTSVSARTLDGGIGYLRVAFFPGVNGQRFARELGQALATLPGCERLIVDLRGNLGGFVGSLRLMSHLAPGRLPIGYSLTRKGQDRGWRAADLPCINKLPSTKLETLWMGVRFLVLNRDRSIRLETEGLGAAPFHGRVAVLVNEHTLSAGEMVAAFVQENGLGTLVGSRTGGQVLGGGNFAVGHGFVLRIPAAAWYTARGTVVEGRGVAPDVEIRPAANAGAGAGDVQLESAIGVLSKLN
jgi:C-terminal processing protease CtpA/Prc